MESKDAEQGSAFGGLLKRYRLVAGLTQEALAERAGMSARGVKYLEGGARLPYPETLQRLAAALALTPADQAALAAAARPSSEASPAAAPARHNLPVQATSFIGREQEQRAVLALLEQAALVTLLGPGGVGKTRLALAVASERAAAYPDGVWLVELAALSDPSLVPGAVLAAVGQREEPGRPALSTLIDSIRDMQLLLVLDNCEHLIGACATLAGALLRVNPRLRILATSREGLAVAGEMLYRVPSLSLPDLRHLPTLEVVPTSAAVRLFVARAQNRGADFTLTAQNAGVVAQICARLDGIPLAIELAAARVGALPVETIAARLDDSCRLLTGGPRTVLPRQQTLRAALDWSHDLLSQPEQVLLRRLAVFAGGWTLEAAEQVCAGETIEAWDILDLHSALINKSLALLEEVDGRPRYRLLETVRQYGQERAGAAGETALLQDRHLGWCLALAEQASPALLGAEQEVWLARLAAEHDNLRAALHRGLRGGGDLRAVQLAGALWRFWEICGLLSEGRQWLEEALASRGIAGVPPVVRARTLNAAGNLAYDQGDFAQARLLHEESLALRRELGDLAGVASSLNNLGNLAWSQGENERARALHEESLTLQRQLGERWGIANALNNLGLVLEQRGNYELATERFAEALALYRELGNSEGIAMLLGNLGLVAHDQADYARARTLYEESLELNRKVGHTRFVANALDNLGNLACEEGDYTAAAALAEQGLVLYRALGDKQGIGRALASQGNIAYAQGDLGAAAGLYKESLALRQSLHDRPGIAESLEGVASVAGAQGQQRDAAQLLAAAEVLRNASGSPLPQRKRPALEQVVMSLRVALGDGIFTAAWAAGRAMILEEAIRLALEQRTARSPAGQ